MFITKQDTFFRIFRHTFIRWIPVWQFFWHLFECIATSERCKYISYLLLLLRKIILMIWFRLNCCLPIDTHSYWLEFFCSSVQLTFYVFARSKKVCAAVIWLFTFLLADNYSRRSQEILPSFWTWSQCCPYLLWSYGQVLLKFKEKFGSWCWWLGPLPQRNDEHCGVDGSYHMCSLLVGQRLCSPAHS